MLGNRCSGVGGDCGQKSGRGPSSHAAGPLLYQVILVDDVARQLGVVSGRPCKVVCDEVRDVNVRGDRILHGLSATPH